MGMANVNVIPDWWHWWADGCASLSIMSVAESLLILEFMSNSPRAPRFRWHYCSGTNHAVLAARCVMRIEESLAQLCT